MATGDAELRGTSLTNTGTLQGANLLVLNNTLTNSGTVLGTSALTVQSATVSNTASGKLFSAGNLLLDSNTLTSAGQVVALGDATLTLVNALTHGGILAAGSLLSVTSQAAITNNGVMQGNGLTLSAGGALSNNGQLTTGNATSTFTAQRILLNNTGSLSAGGDVQMTSRGDITVNGFTGTTGNLTMNVAGTLLNTALIYAGNNLQLFADRIHNINGDILAGNSLWMQKNAAGTANAEIINRSGTIETMRGDLTMNTASLLNSWDSLSASREIIPGDAGGTLDPLPLDGWWEIRTDENGAYLLVREFLNTIPEPEYHVRTGDSEVVTVTASGTAGRIVSGADMTINATRLDNEAAYILAGGNMILRGATLNNQSWQEGTRATETVWTRDASQRYVCGAFECEGYRLTSQTTSVPDGRLYRSVISAGGAVNAVFTSNISNTLANSGANPGDVSGNLNAPSLNTLTSQTIAGQLDPQSLADDETENVSGPQWQDHVQDALQSISGGDVVTGQPSDASLYPLPTGDNGYFVTSNDPDSPYLITVNPKLDGLGQLDPTLYGDLYALLGMRPGDAPRETNSAFTDQSQFLGSAYFLEKLGLNPDHDYRFLGDAVFDTRYVSNYILNQTGSRYINGIGSDLDQMRYLMDSAATAQDALGLRFGVALTAAQIAALSQSILWWESATINGQTVMIPKVYLSPKDVAVQNGSVISGNNVQLAGGTVVNDGSTLTAQNGLAIDSSNSLSNLNSGLINAGGNLALSALGDINNISSAISGKTVQLESVTGSINNVTQAQQWNIDATGRTEDVQLSGTSTGQTASITAKESLDLYAGQDITVTGAEVSSGGALEMDAGRDITVSSNQTGLTYSGRQDSGETVRQEGSAITAGDSLLMSAGRDITSQASGIAAENDVVLQAGRDISLTSATQSDASRHYSKDKTEITESVRQQGTEILSGGDTLLIAGRDITSVASSATAGGGIALVAGRDVTLTTATESEYHYKEEKKKSGGFLSKKTTHTIEEDSATREKGSLLSGDSVTVSAGNDLKVKGSNVVADGDVALRAGNNVDISAATNTDSSWRFKEVKKAGLMGTGGIGVTIGSSKTTHDRREAGTTQSQSASTVGSTGGNVSITAGNQAHISGSDVIANRDISITGDSVVIDPGHDRRTVDETFEQKKSGLTVALSGTVGSAINNVVTNAQETKETSDSRLLALQATKTALSGVQAGQAAALASATGDPNAMGVSLSLTTQKSKSQQHSESDTVSGSTLNAGNNLSVIATGKNKGDNSGDIVIAGSQLKAGGNTTLDAANDVLLLGAANTQKTTGKNSSSGGGVGVSIGAGGSGAGISIFANVNASKGSEKGNGTEWTETTIDSGKTVTINSGRDTVLNGAQVSGDKITADVGRDLLMSSQQDNNDYDSKQTSVAAGGSFTFGSMTGSGYISASEDKMKSRYDSVQEQTGMFAGDGGFDITVGKHTQLDGAVIASTATADKNQLDTGTLGFSDLHNEADYDVSHSGISLSGGGSFGGDHKGNMPGGMVSTGGSSGHAEGTTQAAVAEGTITIRDKDNQKQDIADLSRDPEHANDSISPIFDKEKEQNRLQEVGLISDIGNQAADIARTQGDLNALEIAKEEYGDLKEGATEDERQAWLEDLRDSPKYKEEMKKYGTGSDIQRGIQAATAALQGLAGGDIAGALAGASAPELAHLLKSTEDNPAVNAIAHAILGGAVAALQGNNAAAGAAGAATGELAARVIAGMLYPGVKPSDLSEEQKQTISTLATISAGMAGGIAGDSTASAAVGAQSGKNAAENNLLGGNEETQTKFVQEHAKNIVSCSTDPGSASCQKGLAMQDALMVALPAGLGGGLLAAATPELAAAAQAVLAGCQSAAILCLNQAGILTAEVATPGGVGAAGILTVGKNAAEIAAAKAEVTAVNSAKPGWLQNIQAGNKFNAEQSKNYPYNELYVNKPNGNGYYRVDSYNPATGEIVSRKFTQLADITEATATSYIREAVNKYPAGASIAQVPSSGALGGKQLQGSNILEIPPQIKPIPQSVLDSAKQSNVIIRDTNGKVYK